MKGYEQQGGVFEAQAHVLSGDEQAIQLGIEAARAEDREVDDATARVIAAQLHGGQGSALYSLASTGNLSDERLGAELSELYQSPDPHLLELASVLGTYALHREYKGPVDGWSELWPDHPASDEAQVAANLMRRLDAAAVTTLGQVATVFTAEGMYGLDADNHEELDADTYPWSDAARWHADGGPDELGGDATSYVGNEMVDGWFTRVPDCEVGSRDDMGWCGLVRNEDRPGGVILRENQYDRHSAWQTESDDELTSRWQQVKQEQAAYQQSTRREMTEAGAIALQVWVGSQSVKPRV